MRTRVANSGIFNAQYSQFLHGLQGPKLFRFEAHFSREPEQRGVEDGFVHSQRAHESILLVDETHYFLEILIHNVPTIYEGRSGDKALLIFTGKDIKEGRLARSGGSHDSKYLSRFHMPGDFIQDS